MYAELTYFEGYHFWHIFEYHEHLRLTRLRHQAIRTSRKHGGPLT